jgi:hypothetical protein
MFHGAKKSYVLGLALLAGLWLAGSTVSRSAERKTLMGTIGDTMCGVNHTMGNMSPAECTQKCIEMGSDYALVVGSEVYALEGKEDELETLAGEKVKLTGTVDGKKIQVESVAKQ